MVHKAIAMYPNSLFILGGDMEGKQWFQCRNGDGISFTELYDVSQWKTIQFEKDWRAGSCDTLMQFKIALRSKMREWVGEGGRVDAGFIEEWARNNANSVWFDVAVTMFKPGDLWIDPTKKMSEKLLEAGVCSGYRCKHEGKDKDGVFRTRGEILPADGGNITEKKGSITTHSIQGKTVSDGKIFISLTGSFEYAMIYTAVSRACRFSQIVFVA
jgi:hypothetical protein